MPSRTFTLGLVRFELPPGVTLLAYASAMLDATAAGLGRAVRTLAHVRYKYTCVQSREQAQSTIKIGSERLRWNQT